MRRYFISALLCAVGWLAVSAARADVYGIKSKSLNGYGPYQWEPPAILYKFADNGTGLSLVGTICSSGGTQLRADALACSPYTGMWFFEPSDPTLSATSTLRSLDSATAVAGAGVATLTNRGIFGAAFDSQGRLWAADQQQDQLLQVSTADGQVLQSANLTYNGNPFNLDGGGGDIAFDAAGTCWLNYEDRFFTVDTATGAMTLVHTYTGISLWMVGAAFSPLDASHLYVFDVSIGWYNDDLLRFDVDDNFTRQDVALRIFDDQFNAGRGDLAVTPAAAFILGDLNHDGLVNNQDIAPFVLALTDQAAWQAQYPDVNLLYVGDINGDAAFNNQDIAPFVTLLTGSGSSLSLLDPSGSNSVPEPASLGLLALGGLLMLRRIRR